MAWEEWLYNIVQVKEKSVRLEMACGRSATDNNKCGGYRRAGRRPYRTRRSNGETATDSLTTSDTDTTAAVKTEPVEPINSSLDLVDSLLMESEDSLLKPVVDVDDVKLELATDA